MSIVAIGAIVFFWTFVGIVPVLLVCSNCFNHEEITVNDVVIILLFLPSSIICIPLFIIKKKLGTYFIKLLQGVIFC